MPSLDGVFVNDLYESSAHVLEHPIQTHSNTNLACGGSNLPMCPNIDQVPSRSDLGAFMATPLATIAIMALDLVDWRAPLLTYLLEEVLPPKRTEAR